MSDIGLGFRKTENETWREAVARVARPYGLDNECLSAYNRSVEQGVGEEEAAWCALYDWDCLEVYVDGKPKKLSTKPEAKS